MARGSTRPPAWFWLAVVLLFLWGAAGVVNWYRQVTLGAAAWGEGVTDWDLRYYAALPAWYNAVYFVATAAGLAGAVALLVRSTAAEGLFWVSLAAVIVMFGWTFAATDLLAHKGAAVAVPFPAVIALLAVAEIALARRARRRGWTG